MRLAVAVWVAMIMMTGLASTSMRLLFAQDRFRDLFSRIKKLFGLHESLDEAHVAQRQCTAARAHLLEHMRTILIVSVFGAAVPPLLMLAPVVLWLQLRANVWCTKRRHATGDHATGGVIATSVWVAAPIATFQWWLHVCGWMINGFILYDLDFSFGPTILYLMLAVIGSRVVLPMISKLYSRKLQIDKTRLGGPQSEGTLVPLLTAQEAQMSDTYQHRNQTRSESNYAPPIYESAPDNTDSARLTTYFDDTAQSTCFDDADQSTACFDGTGRSPTYFDDTKERITFI